jgi:hypothetical protein
MKIIFAAALLLLTGCDYSIGYGQANLIPATNSITTINAPEMCDDVDC